jgi:hypothetical protein
LLRRQKAISSARAAERGSLSARRPVWTGSFQEAQQNEGGFHLVHDWLAACASVEPVFLKKTVS